MEKRVLSRIVTAVGILLAVVSVLADHLGLGSVPGIGWKQGLGTVVGIVLIVIGAYWRRPSSASH